MIIKSATYSGDVNAIRMNKRADLSDCIRRLYPHLLRRGPAVVHEGGCGWEHHAISRCKPPPTRSAATSRKATDLRVPDTPSSLSMTMNVATQGKYMAKTTEAMTSCLAVMSNGANMPIPTSFRRKPMIRAVAASLGRPKRPDTTGCRVTPIWCISPER